MQKYRVIPCLQLMDDSLVKTVQFKKHTYIGDPVNTVRIFNELEVDELCFLDIRASLLNKSPDYTLLQQIADECFMPLSYGGGIKDFDTVKKILSCGFEKVVLNTHAYLNPELIEKIAENFGSQAIIGSIDIKKGFLGACRGYIKSGTEKIKVNIIDWAQQLQDLGAGELMVTSIDREGTWSGYDLEIVQKIAKSVTIPVIANGGAGSLAHLDAAIENGASAVASGSAFVYQQKGMGVLINFPYHFQ